MNVIDFHNHYYPPEYLEAIQKGPSNVRVTFDEVLLSADGDKIKAGQPTVKGAKVVGEIVRHGKGEKIVVFKFKRRKMYRRRNGHRQNFTNVKIEEIAV